MATDQTYPNRKIYLLKDMQLLPVDCFFLTDKEYEVLRALRHAKPAHSVAHECGMDRNGFNHITSRLRKKLKMNTTQLVALAINTFPPESKKLQSVQRNPLQRGERNAVD